MVGTQDPTWVIHQPQLAVLAEVMEQLATAQLERITPQQAPVLVVPMVQPTLAHTSKFSEEIFAARKER